MDETVKKNLEKLLEYQKKDIELRKLNAFVKREEELASMNKNEKIFNEAKRVIAECEDQANAIISSYAELSKYVDDNEAMLAELENTDAESEEQLAERVKKLESLKSKFQNADKKARDFKDRSKDVCRARVDAVKSGNAARQNYKEAKAKHGELISSKAGEANALKAELEKMRPTLDEALFAEYKKLVEEKHFPPVVPASGDDKKGMFNCGGCGLGLPQQGNSLLKDQGWCRCDNCHRIIVKLQ